MRNSLPPNRHKVRFLTLLAPLLLVAVLTAVQVPPARAQTETSGKLEKIEDKLSAEKQRVEALKAKEAQLQREAADLRQKMIAVAAKTQEQEALITNLEDQLVALRHDQEERRTDLARRRGQLSGTLGALSKLSTDATRNFFLYPGEPLEAVHSAMLLQAAVPALRDRADILRVELEALRDVEMDIADKLASLSAAEQSLKAERAAMEDLFDRKQRLARQMQLDRGEGAKRIAKLAKEAESIKDLMEKLSKARPKARPAPPTPEAGHVPPAPTDQAVAVRPPALPDVAPFDIRAFPDSGRVSAPVTGKLVQRYGQDLGFGQTAKGLRIETRTGAQVVAPHDGRITFAGQFRDHGLILIIEHRGGYHTVLSGFDALDAVTGQWLLAGEPVGVMGGGESGRNPELYVELRRDGQPVNPLNWISAASIRVHG